MPGLLEEAALTSRKLKWWGAAPAELISLIRPLPSQAKAALRKRMKTMGGPRAAAGKAPAEVRERRRGAAVRKGPAWPGLGLRRPRASAQLVPAPRLPPDLCAASAGAAGHAAGPETGRRGGGQGASAGHGQRGGQGPSGVGGRLCRPGSQKVTNCHRTPHDCLTRARSPHHVAASRRRSDGVPGGRARASSGLPSLRALSVPASVRCRGPGSSSLLPLLCPRSAAASPGLMALSATST